MFLQRIVIKHSNVLSELKGDTVHQSQTTAARERRLPDGPAVSDLIVTTNKISYSMRQMHGKQVQPLAHVQRGEPTSLAFHKQND